MVTRRLAVPFPAFLLAGGLFALGLGSATRAADKDEVWTEVRSPHFTVVSNGGEKQARRVVDQFEQIRGVFHAAFPHLRVDPSQPIVILAAKNENTLKALLPEYWERKGHTHPAGIFIPGLEKHYVALRLDVSGDNPYHVIYHEYMHMLIGLNYRSMPVWLDEGFAEFYGNTRIGDKDVGLGQPDESHLILLNQSKLLPLDVLLKVTHDSPYYNEANKTSVFYAESWALVHYLMLDEQLRKSQVLQNFFRLVQSDTDELEAARRSFGDLSQLQKNLETYARQTSFRYLKMKAPTELGEKDYAVRALPPAESLALRGDFHLRTRRVAEARSLLEEALRIDANLARAHESMGFLLFQLGEHEQAAKWFAQAVKLDSRSYLAHYYHARLLVERSTGPERLAEASASLQHAIELNPNFAPAYDTLAAFYAIREDTLEKALAAARKAVELEPAAVHYRLNLAFVLMRMNRADESRLLGLRALTAAKSPEERLAAQNFLEQVNRYQAYLADRKRAEEEGRRRRDDREAQISPDTTGSDKDVEPETSEKSKPAPADAATWPSLVPRNFVLGKITEITCAAPTEMLLTVSVAGTPVKLHAANFFKVDYLSAAWEPPANFNPCVHLKRLSAQISYRLAPGQAYEGEIIAIEVKK